MYRPGLPSGASGWVTTLPRTRAGPRWTVSPPGPVTVTTVNLAWIGSVNHSSTAAGGEVTGVWPSGLAPTR